MFSNYFKIAWRNLRRNKVFSFINISGLAVGIAASLILFMVVNYELSYERFQTNYNRIYHIVTQNRFSTGTTYNPGIAYPALDALRASMPDVQFAAFNNINGSQVAISEALSEGSKKFIESNGILFCEPQFFTVFNSYHWLDGNASSLQQPNNVVLSKSTAEKYFGKWQTAVGKTIKIDNVITAKVSGILQDVPKNTDLPLNVLISFPTLKAHRELYNYNDYWGSVGSSHQIFMLLPKGVTEADMNKRLLQWGQVHYPKNNTSAASNFLQPLSNMHFDTRFSLFGTTPVSRSKLWILSIIGFVVIIMACINFINLSTAQAVNRSKEVGIRKVLGSHRNNLFFQMMGETAMIVCIAVLIALLLAQAALPYVKHIASIEENLSLFTLPTLTLLVLLTFFVTLLAGLYPAFVLSRFNPITAIRNKLSAKQSGGVALRRGLVITQFAISQVLIIATIVAVSQMNFINNADLGFNKNGVLVLWGSNDSLSLLKQPSFKQELLHLPGVQATSFNSDPPSSDNSWSTNFAYNHLPDENYQVYLKFGDADYLKTYGMHLLAGRNIVPTDTLREVLVNETLAKKLSPKHPEDVIGKPIKLGDGNWNTITGMVQDFKAASLRDEIHPMLIGSNRKYYYSNAIKLRTNNLSATQQQIQNLWNKTFPEYAYNAQFFDDTINEFYKQESQLSLLYKIFAGLAIFISCLGLYGLVSFMAVQKTKEVGIRKVLGAGIGNIVYIFSKEFTLLIITAFAIAAPLAWYISNSWLDRFAYRIHMQVWTFLLAVVLSIVIAWITVGYKAVRASLANPVKSLRTE